MSSLPVPDDGIEILVDMARRGQIDPWNVDISAVAERYLHAVSTEIDEAKPRESQLRVTGKTLLYLAILLRMKSDLLAGFDPFAVDEIEDNPFFDGLPEPDAEPFVPVPIDLQNMLKRRYGSLEQVLKRRTSAKQPRIRPVTLEDLIRELKKYEILEKERVLKQKVETADRRRARMRDYSQFTTEDITQLAHEEFQEETVDQVLAAFEEMLPRGSAPEARVSLVDLVDVTGLDGISVFLSLLFLEARHEVEMHQEDFYSDEIWVGWNIDE
jgi:segregation and condensation protein A